jgi:hypothetical protein
MPHLEKRCLRCSETKPLSEFYPHRTNKKARRGHCISCHNQRSAEWNAANKQRAYEIRRRSHLKTLYGISLEQYNDLLQEQNGLCAICSRHHSEFKLPLNVDHNHRTNEIRGLLCNYCNRGLAAYHDKSHYFHNAAVYLEQASTGLFVPDRKRKRKRKKRDEQDASNIA